MRRQRPGHLSVRLGPRRLRRAAAAGSGSSRGTVRTAQAQVADQHPRQVWTGSEVRTDPRVSVLRAGQPMRGGDGSARLRRIARRGNGRSWSGDAFPSFSRETSVGMSEEPHRGSGVTLDPPLSPGPLPGRRGERRVEERRRGEERCAPSEAPRALRFYHPARL